MDYQSFIETQRKNMTASQALILDLQGKIAVVNHAQVSDLQQELDDVQHDLEQAYGNILWAQAQVRQVAA